MVYPADYPQVDASTLSPPATPYCTQPVLAQQAFGVRAARLQVPFHCYCFSQ